MTTYINADDGIVSGVAGLKYGADNSGSLVLQTNGATAITISAAQVVTFAGAVSLGALTTSGNLTFTGTGNRILGDFSNATIANRVSFQNSVANGNTNIQTLPNGTSLVSGLLAFNNTDPTNAGFGGFQAVGSEVRLTAGITGTGTYPYLAMYTGGSERLRIDTSGNVGIGTSSPTGKLDVKGGTYSQLVVGANLYASVTVGRRPANDSYASLVFSAGGATDPKIEAQTTDLTFFSNNAERMRITTGGLVGILDSSPDSPLTVGTGAYGGTTGTVHIKHNGAYSFGVGLFVETTGGTDDPSIVIKNVTGGYTYGIAVNDSGALAFRANTNPAGGYGSDRMTIANNGVTLINQTSQVSTERFGVTGDNIVCSLKGTNTGNVTTLRIERYASDGDGITFFYGATQKGYISVISTGTGYNTLSDYRLKDNIQPMTGALEKVALLKPRVYNWKGLNKAGQGFIAHELQEVVPECVTGNKDELDEEGNPKYQGIDTSFLVATLTAAIQELNAKVDALEAKLASK